MKNILVFPCGSEIGLEIYRSLKYSAHFNLVGANSVDDHGKFLYDNYLKVPYVTDNNFIPFIAKVVAQSNIDAIYPTMDSVIVALKSYEDELGCPVISSPLETVNICLSKTKTYEHLKDLIYVPKRYKSLNDVKDFPIFMKPDVGYGGRGAKLVETSEEALHHLKKNPSAILLENLPGQEFTVDCFTDANGVLMFASARTRNRIVNGISVNTTLDETLTDEISEIANKINTKLSFFGAWFFQLKKSETGELGLLEIASRIAGSSSIHRNLGVNFAMLSLFQTFGQQVTLFENNYEIVLDRALTNRYKLDFTYDFVYVDFDDCLIIKNSVNTELLAFIYQAINEKKQVILITKHKYNIHKTLETYRLTNIFDKIIHLKDTDNKYKYIENSKSIFIDDSFKERFDVYQKHGIPVFSPDMVESLIR